MADTKVDVNRVFSAAQTLSLADSRMVRKIESVFRSMAAGGRMSLVPFVKLICDFVLEVNSTKQIADGEEQSFIQALCFLFMEAGRLQENIKLRKKLTSTIPASISFSASTDGAVNNTLRLDWASITDYFIDENIRGFIDDTSGKDRELQLAAGLMVEDEKPIEKPDEKPRYHLINRKDNSTHMEGVLSLHYWHYSGVMVVADKGYQGLKAYDCTKTGSGGYPSRYIGDLPYFEYVQCKRRDPVMDELGSFEYYLTPPGAFNVQKGTKMKDDQMGGPYNAPPKSSYPIDMDTSNDLLGAVFSSKHLVFFSAAKRPRLVAVYQCLSNMTGIWTSALNVGGIWCVVNTDYVVDVYSLEYLMNNYGTPTSFDFCFDKKKIAVPMKKLIGHTEIITQIIDLPDIDLLATASKDHQVMLWDGKSLGVSGKVVTPTGLRDMSYNPYTKSLLVVGGSNEAILYPLAGARNNATILTRSGTLRGHIASIHSCCFLKRNIACTADDIGFIRFWDVAELECFQIIRPEHVGFAFDRLCTIGRDCAQQWFMDNMANSAPGGITRFFYSD